MMVLLFKVDEDRYSFDVKSVVEVIPGVPLQKISGVPDYIAGLLNYRGNIVPVIDLSQLISGHSVASFLSSRIVIIRSASAGRYIALLGEHVTETLRIPDEDFSDKGVEGAGCAFIDKIAINEKGMIQHINVGELLPDEVRALIDSAKDEHQSELENG